VFHCVTVLNTLFVLMHSLGHLFQFGLNSTILSKFEKNYIHVDIIHYFVTGKQPFVTSITRRSRVISTYLEITVHLIK